MTSTEKKKNLKRKFHSISYGKIECSISNLSVAKCSGIQSTSSLHSLKRSECSTLKKIKKETSTVVVNHKSFQFHKEVLKNIIILGQVKIDSSSLNINKAWNKVIVALSLNQQAVIVIDQHAVHERIRYEYYYSLLISQLFNGQSEEKVEKFDKTMIGLKGLAEPMIFRKSYISYEQQSTILVPKRWEYNLEKVNVYGIEYDVICKADNSISIRVKAVPCILGETMEPSLVLDICEFLESLDNNKKTVRIPRKIDEILMSKACKNAIKFNDKLDPSLPNRLISQLLHCEHPLYCVHGRNSIYPLSQLKNAKKLLFFPRPKRKFRLESLST